MEKKKKLFDEIACTAHDLYEKRGRRHGYALQDWLEAEKIVMERYGGEIERVAETITAAREKKTAEAPKKKTAKAKATSSKTSVASETKKKRTVAKKKTE